MFGINFYPTPLAVIEQMTAGVDFQNKVILEPSAGKGNIVDYLQKYGAKEVIACELNQDLRSILANKCNVIEDNFLHLKSEQISHLDFIIMNPPFSNAEKHIQHAWDIAPGGCQIIALFNSETLRNSYSRERRMFEEIVNDYGNIQNLGNCFSTAERKTDVEVTLVNLFKPNTEETEFDGYFDLEERFESNETPGIISYNFIKDIVSRFVGSVKEYDKVLDAAVNITNISGPIGLSGLTFQCSDEKRPIERATFKKELQKNSWRIIFNKMNMNKYVTTKVREDINKFVEQQTQVPFTFNNVFKMIDLIIGTHAERMDKVLVEAFDLICSYSDKNSTAGEKWKTNSDYKLNRRFIRPYVVEVGYSGEFKLSYHYQDRMEDIIKAICHLTGTDYNKTTPLYTFVDRMNPDFGKWYCWGFFNIRGYKKGTMHFEFQDEKILDLFNRRVAEIQGWRIPKQTDRKRKGTERTKSFEMELF